MMWTRVLGLSVAVGLAACASNPHNVSSDRTARLEGKRAIHYPEIRMREFVYFTHVNKIDMTNRWGDYPHKVDVPGGMNSLMVVCEWYGDLSDKAMIKSASTIKQKFIAGHEYEFKSTPSEGKTCVTRVIDLTLAAQEPEQKEPEKVTESSPAPTTTATANKRKSRSTAASRAKARAKRRR